MAVGNLFLGTARKKLGDVVFYRTEGQQRSRVRNRNPKNPKSAKQSVQRMVLATAAKMASAYEPIVNHSFEGVPIGAKSVQMFRKKAMNALRSAAAAYLNVPITEGAAADFAIKGSPIIGALDRLQISQGRLPMAEYTADDATVDITLAAALSSASITTQEAYVAELAKLGLAPGDQITYVVMSQNINVVVASATIDDVVEQDFAQQIGFCRLTFVSELPDEFSGTLLSGTSINPALIEESFGALPSFTTTTVETTNYLRATFSSVLPAGYNIMEAGVIRSQRHDGGWYYSSCYMVANLTSFDANDAYPTYMTYMDGVATIDVGSKYYLQHAVAAPFGRGE